MLLPACGSSSQDNQRSNKNKDPASQEQVQNNVDNTRARQTNNIQETIEPDVVIEELVKCIEADGFICDVEMRILELTNEFRLQSGKSPLENSPRIGWVSRDWSNKQAQSGGIGHSGFPRERNALLSSKFSRTANLSAENVAYSYFNADLVEDIAKGFVNMWINSSGHRANMLANHKFLGVGIAKRGTQFYATQIFSNND